MSKVISTIELSATLSLSECTDGWWLYDATRGMNPAMRAKSANDAFVGALTYYQNRLSAVEQEHKAITEKVQAFVSQFAEDADD